MQTRLPFSTRLQILYISFNNWQCSSSRYPPLQLWKQLTSASPTADSLNTVVLLTFADLKKYKYYYWFAFPAFVVKPAWEIDGELTLIKEDEVAKFCYVLSTFATETRNKKVKPLAKAYEEFSANRPGERAACLLKKTATGSIKMAKLSEYSTFFDGVEEEEASIKAIPGIFFSFSISQLNSRIVSPAHVVLCRPFATSECPGLAFTQRSHVS
jgi:hypothetical protein